ncbi:TRAP transporter substrate-binding protein [Kushneria sp. Sum13]|uniref:TRAP transporter substrate-binding protein n=1 Tax=Kushneria sp. Sum13 TaxID=3459196 RepID=UPI004045ACC6
MRTTLISAALALSLAVPLDTAGAAEVLRVAHVWPGGSLIDRELFQAWAKSVEKASNGELRVQVFPGQTLAKSDQTYQSAVSGIADIGSTAQGYNAGRFPLTQVVELPGISQSSHQGSCVLQSLYDQGALGDEYRDSHVLFMFTTGPGYLHTKRKLISTPADMAGLRLRRPTSVVGDMMTRQGAQAVGMPAPDVFTSMQRGVLDGLSFNWEAMKTFRLNEQTRYHTEVPLYDLSLVATMNQKRYDALPANLRAVIDDHSGMAWSMKAAAVYDQLIAQGREEAVEAGHEFLAVEAPLEDPQWGPVLQETIDTYLQKTGGNAQAVYDDARRLAERCTGSQQGA